VILYLLHLYKTERNTTAKIFAKILKKIDIALINNNVVEMDSGGKRNVVFGEKWNSLNLLGTYIPILLKNI